MRLHSTQHVRCLLVAEQGELVNGVDDSLPIPVMCNIQHLTLLQLHHSTVPPLSGTARHQRLCSLPCRSYKLHHQLQAGLLHATPRFICHPAPHAVAVAQFNSTIVKNHTNLADSLCGLPCRSYKLRLQLQAALLHATPRSARRCPGHTAPACAYGCSRSCKRVMNTTRKRNSR
jgi:hypothetical protein